MRSWGAVIVIFSCHRHNGQIFKAESGISFSEKSEIIKAVEACGLPSLWRLRV